ncbi:TOMM precursor leader peptide-binding protein [Microbacterium rhizomatis]|uniref:TOMM leader peptide-binding protein n=1 Tax=Microbacterium rhizomatis TaxID=1631477 RepID=A0A5J5J1M0_9MICO|nr:TOMM precursor leader peptide-binding protein [Microbacterium rhizomatis]KAA9108436.1 TOMM precursor leader peptide-binding protein [Microbacterium rhizomatis]
MTITETRSATHDAEPSAEPRWAVDPRVSLRILDGAGIVALRGDDASLLRGPTIKAVAESIEGRTSDEVATLLGTQIAPAKVYYAIGQLKKRGIIVPAADPRTLAERAWWSEMGVGADAASEVRRATVAVVTLRGVGAGVTAAVAATLGDEGCSVLELGEVPAALDPAPELTTPDLVIVLAGDYLDDELATINERCLDAGIPWLLVWPDAAKPWIGPLFRPGATACWECLRNRRSTHRRFHAVLAEDGASSAAVPMTAGAQASALVGRMAGLEALKALGGIAQPTIEGAPEASAILTELDLTDWRTRHHVVVRRPQCPACGDPIPSAAEPVVPQPERPRRGDDGGTRTVSADETYRRYRHHVSPVTGAVPFLEEHELPFPGAHLWMSGTNLALAPKDLLSLKHSLRSMTAGKGTTREQARAGALAEALERYSTMRQGGERAIRGSLRSLGARAIHPNDAMLFSERQYAHADEHGSPESWFNGVPERFDEEAVIDWTPVWSLTHDREYLLPTGYCYYGGSVEATRGIASDSNGCAAGNTVTEAILQAFYELVERDGVAIWWYNRLRRPAVDLASFGNTWIDDMVDDYRSRGRDTWAIDLTTDLGIPTFAAFSRRTSDGADAILMGFGAHLDPEIAVLRALGEINQSSYLDEHPHDEDSPMDRELMHWLRTATIENQPYLVPDPAAPVWHAQDHATQTGADLAVDVRTCRDRVERAGMSMYAIDQTRPDIGLPVVRVVVPGLRHFWSRFAPGRLYEVPIALGWLEEAVPESELNPIPFFL